MTVRADLIIVGAGLAGAAAAFVAARRGLNVVVLEAFGPAHRNGSSHGSARIFRRAYPDPLYVRLTGESGQRWRALEDAAGERVLTMTGAIDFGPEREPERLHRVLAECGVPAELLPEQAAAERWPFIDFEGAGPVMYHEDAGALDPDRAIAAMLRLAAASGADVRFDTPVEKLATAASGGAVAITAGQTFTAPVVVVAAGPWIAPLIAGLVELPPLTVTQQQVFHFAPAPGRAAEPWPVFIQSDGSGYRYGLPGGRDGGVPGAVKIGEHNPGQATTAAGRDFRIDPSARERVRAFVADRLPGLDPAPAPAHEASCLYTWTANEDFILDRPGGGPFVVASPCSGHGAKFAPLLGEIIADLAAGRPSPDPRFTLAAHLARTP